MGDGDDDNGAPSDTMRGRIPGSRVKLWVLLGANRWILAGTILAVVFAVLVVLGAVDPFPLRRTIQNQSTIEWVFQGFLTAIITAATLVVTINQLVISQELGAIGDQRERMDESMAFREDIEEKLDLPISPPEPSAFLRALIDETRSCAEDFRAAVSDSRDEQLRERVDAYVDDLIGNADAVDDQLEGSQFGTFEVVFAALNYNYSWKIYEARRIRREHADALTDEANRTLDEVIEALQFFGPAREHFKTLYFQWALVDLSRAMLYTSLPALVVVVVMMTYVNDPYTIPGATVGIDNMVWVTSAAVTVALAPFSLLVSYVLRVGTVAKRTLAMGPFVLRETDRSDEIDWE